MERRKVRATMKFRLKPGVLLQLNCQKCRRGCWGGSHGHQWQFRSFRKHEETLATEPQMAIRNVETGKLYDCPVSAARPPSMEIPEYRQA